MKQLSLTPFLALTAISAFAQNSGVVRWTQIVGVITAPCIENPVGGTTDVNGNNQSSPCWGQPLDNAANTPIHCPALVTMHLRPQRSRISSSATGGPPDPSENQKIGRLARKRAHAPHHVTKSEFAVSSCGVGSGSSSRRQSSVYWCQAVRCPSSPRRQKSDENASETSRVLPCQDRMLLL